jgi:hypothetical protein
MRALFVNLFCFGLLVIPNTIQAQVVIPNEQIPYEDPDFCRTNIGSEPRHVIFDAAEENLYANYTFREIFFGGTDNITCPAFISLRLLTPGLTDVERSVFCLSYDEEQDTIIGFAEGERDAYLICSEPSVPMCDRVNATREEALAIVGLGAGATAGASVATTAAGITAVTHSSGAVILTGSSGYIAGTLGTVGSGVLAFLTAPATLTVAAVSVVAVGGAVYVCQPEE